MIKRFDSMQQVKTRNAVTGRHFFDRDTLSFFNSIVYNYLYDGRFFITSEKPPHAPRHYSIREAMDDGSIQTVGEFGQYGSLEEARAAVKELY